MVWVTVPIGNPQGRQRQSCCKLELACGRWLVRSSLGLAVIRGGGQPLEGGTLQQTAIGYAIYVVSDLHGALPTLLFTFACQTILVPPSIPTHVFALTLELAISRTQVRTSCGRETPMLPVFYDTQQRNRHAKSWNQEIVGIGETEKENLGLSGAEASTTSKQALGFFLDSKPREA